MKFYVDADACPVLEEIFTVAKPYGIKVVLIKSYSHFSHDPLPNIAEVVYVDQGKDMADFAIIERVKQNDIVITHDYGLAAICLGKKCIVLHPKGFLYTNRNIDRLLHTRHEQAHLRRAGVKTRGPRAFTREDKEKFKALLIEMITKLSNQNT